MARSRGKFMWAGHASHRCFFNVWQAAANGLTLQHIATLHDVSSPLIGGGSNVDAFVYQLQLFTESLGGSASDSGVAGSMEGQQVTLAPCGSL